MNIGLIRGGSRPNIVPDLAEAELDIRITPSLAAVGGALILLEKSIARDSLPVEIVRCHENPPMDTSADHPMVRMLLEHGAVLAGAPWFSDAAHLSKGGVPSICIGPGSIDQAHTANEFISIEALQQGVEFFSSLIRDLGKARPSGNVFGQSI